MKLIKTVTLQQKTFFNFETPPNVSPAYTYSLASTLHAPVLHPNFDSPALLQCHLRPNVSPAYTYSCFMRPSSRPGALSQALPCLKAGPIYANLHNVMKDGTHKVQVDMSESIFGAVCRTLPVNLPSAYAIVLSHNSIYGMHV